MLKPLPDSMDDLATSTKARFVEVTDKAPFSAGAAVEVSGSSDPQVRKLYDKLGHVYAVRNKTVWQQRVALLLAGAERAVEQEAREGRGRHHYTEGPHSAALLKYSEANPEHYAEEIPQFPQEANPLDPQLGEFERLLEPVQLAHQRAHMSECHGGLPRRRRVRRTDPDPADTRTAAGRLRGRGGVGTGPGRSRSRTWRRQRRCRHSTGC